MWVTTAGIARGWRQKALLAAVIGVSFFGMSRAETVAGVWELTCKPVAGEARLGCVASTSVLSPKSGAQVLGVEVIPAGTLGNANAVLRLELPHGIALNANIGVQIDDGDLIRVPLTSSTSDGVTAMQQIGEDIIASLREGTGMAVTVVTLEGDTLTNSVSLVGLTLVLDAMARMNAPD